MKIEEMRMKIEDKKAKINHIEETMKVARPRIVMKDCIDISAYHNNFEIELLPIRDERAYAHVVVAGNCCNLNIEDLLKLKDFLNEYL